ncbi:MAG: S8 family serine peptidase [Candidatus Heimdallarchaeota archaeon]|nr:S8 family serine peptidase [Candidatus Heimdallarchaeota archaeon]
MNKKFLTILTAFIMLSSMGIGSTSADYSDDRISMLDGSMVSVIPDQTYVYSLGSSGSSRYDEFYITTSGASELTATITPNFRYRYESTDDFDLYYKAGSQVSSCGTTTCSGYDLVSWKAEAFMYGDEQIIISSPADTTHYFRVQRYSGAGTEYFNFVATVTQGGGGGDTTAPTVTITSPSNGATVSDTVTVSASASDNVAVDRVEFSVDGQLKSTDYTSPYSFSWDTTLYSDASHSVTAEAFDAAGNSASDTNSYTVDNGGTPPPTGCGETPRVTGSMPFWNDAIDVEKAHAAGCYGGDAVVVILDTGLSSQYTNLFPSGAINTQYSRSFTKSGGFDSVEWNGDNTEGHGTSVTATVLGYYVPSTWGMTNNYVMGVAPNAEIVMGRVVYWIGSGVTETQMLNNWAEAINYYVNLNNQGAFGNKGMIISMSLGYSATNTALSNAVANAENSGVVISTSAGNDGPSASTTGYPANLADAVSVAAAGWSGYTGSYGVAGIIGDIPEDNFSGLTIADFSSRGKVDITGMGWQLALPTYDASYMYISGTSFSCPQVSGVFALMFSMYGHTASVSFLLSTMQSGAHYMSPSTTWGAGFVQADGALGL